MSHNIVPGVPVTYFRSYTTFVEYLELCAEKTNCRDFFNSNLKFSALIFQTKKDKFLIQ